MDGKTISRRDILKLSSLVVAGLALPHSVVRALGETDKETDKNSFIPHRYFQWQNEFLRKIIYPMRETKLRDFLVYYQEVDVWAHYKNKDISALASEVDEYKRDWELNALAAQKEYTELRDYFLKNNARSDYSDFRLIDEGELTEINNIHTTFVQSWPKDIRGEHGFLNGVFAQWRYHCDSLGVWIESRERRHEAMHPEHPKYIPEGEELVYKEAVTRPMAEREKDKLRAFLATYDKIEERKLAWYKLKKSNPDFKTPETEFLAKFPSERKVTIQDIARWKIEEYKKSIAHKNQYELLDLINQRFQKEPKRFPAWLQYMVVHFSGMRYASAHGSWADPRDLLVRLRAPEIEAEIKLLDDATIETICAQKVAAYEATNSDARPKLAAAPEKEWQDKLSWYLPNVKAKGPKTRRQGLIDLLKTEYAYETMSKTTPEVQKILLSMKSTFPAWVWHEIMRLTQLRITEVSDLHWEVLTPQEVTEELHSPVSSGLRAIINAWEHHHIAAWRDEHARTHELLVTRAVCNEAAEHCQHIRGHRPPGGLTSKPQWYKDNEAAGKLPGAYFVKPNSGKDYIQGASILWLRFVDSKPSPWQIAKVIETKQKVGLLPDEFTKGSKTKDQSGWVYDINGVITRTRTTILPDKTKEVHQQWLRWYHEATVAEVAETVDGMMVITFETALPDNDRDVSAVGTFKMPLSWHLSDGTEDQYNRSFVGYVPEGQIPVDHLKTMLDWNRIFGK